MNNKEIVQEITQTTGVETEKCIRILDSLEIVLTNELEGTGGVRKFFDRIFLLLDALKSRQKNESKILLEKVMVLSESDFDECQKVINALTDILENKIDTSKSAKFKFDTVYQIVNFFRSK